MQIGRRKLLQWLGIGAGAATLPISTTASLGATTPGILSGAGVGGAVGSMVGSAADVAQKQDENISLHLARIALAKSGRLPKWFLDDMMGEFEPHHYTKEPFSEMRSWSPIYRNIAYHNKLQGKVVHNFIKNNKKNLKKLLWNKAGKVKLNNYWED